MFRMTKKLLQQALDLSAAATVILDRAGKRIVYSNAAMEALLGCSAGSLVGREIAGLRDGGPQLLLDPDKAADAAPQEVRWRAGRARGQDLQVATAPLTDNHGDIALWLLTATAPLSDARLSGAAGQPVATSDSATGLPDRAAFEHALARDWASGRRVRRRVSLLLFRIDSFAAYREVFGRHAADSCLRKVGHAIGGCLRRDADLVARYSEDQFVALVGGADEAQAGEFAQRIADRVRLLAIHHPRSAVDRFVTVAWSATVRTPGLHDDYRALLAGAEAGLPPARNDASAADSA